MTALQPFPTLPATAQLSDVITAVNQIARVRLNDIAQLNNIQVATQAAQGYVPPTPGNANEFLNGATPAAFTALKSAMIVGTTTNDSAAAGYIGEYVESVIVSGSAVALSNVTQANITSISLTAGDWDVRFLVDFAGGASTVFSYAILGISSTSATLDLTTGKSLLQSYPASYTPFASASFVSVVSMPYRISLAATTTIYLVADCNFSTSTWSAYGVLSARRIR